MRVRRLPLRVRLTLWNAAVLALVLSAFAATAYVFLFNKTRAIADEFLAETADAVADAITLERAGGTPDSLAVELVVREFRFRDIAVAVYDAVAARPLAMTPPSTTLAPVLPEDVREVLALSNAQRTGYARVQAGTFQFTSTAQGDSIESLMAVLPVRVGERPMIIVVAQHLRLRARVLAEARDAMLVALPLALLAVALGGFLLARHGLRPVALMRERAELIEATTLHERLPVGAPPHDELGRMALVFNALLERLDRAFDQQRNFMADASHELRTPVAVVRAEAEHALAGDRSVGELREALSITREDSSRMTRIVDDLFLLSRAGAGDQPMATAELYLDDLAAECVRAMRSLAATKGITIACEAEPDLQLRGDEALLRRLVINLLDNAIKYTPDGGSVTVRVRRHESGFLLSVSDTGPGIPEAMQSRLFERFYRGADEGAARAGAGAGLGLAIVRWVARAHGGDVRLASSNANGSTLEVNLRSLTDSVV